MVICVNLITCALILLFLVETRPAHEAIEVTHYSPVLTELGHEETADLELPSLDHDNRSPVIEKAVGKDQNFAKFEEKEEIVEEKKALLLRRSVQLAVGSYGLLALGQIVLDETLPLYMKLAKDQGGFSYQTHDIGIVLSVAGGVFMIFTLFVLPVVANYNKSSLYFYGCLATMPIAVIMPLLPRLSPDDNVVWTLLLVSLIWKNVSLTLAFTAVCVQVSESVLKDTEVASVNAIGQSMASLSRSVGPACGGLLWAAFLSVEHVEGNFYIVCCIMLLCIVLGQFSQGSKM